MNICLCTKDDSYRIRKNFGSYDELLKWTQEQIKKESKINIGDNVEIIDEGCMYTTLGTDFFTNAYWVADDFLDEEKMFDIIRYYEYKEYKTYNGIRTAIVEAEYDDKYILSIPSDDLWHTDDYIVIGKEGVKKVNA